QTSPPETAAAPEPLPMPRDESHRFPKEGLAATSIVGNHVLGQQFLPGGNVAEYEHDGQTYRRFFVTVESAEKAGLLVVDVQGRLSAPKFIAHFGGYFGTAENGEPWFIFSKNQAVAGIVGLSLEEADALARQFAGRID